MAPHEPLAQDHDPMLEVRARILALRQSGMQIVVIIFKKTQSRFH